MLFIRCFQSNNYNFLIYSKTDLTGLSIHKTLQIAYIIHGRKNSVSFFIFKILLWKLLIWVACCRNCMGCSATEPTTAWTQWTSLSSRTTSTSRAGLSSWTESSAQSWVEHSMIASSQSPSSSFFRYTKAFFSYITSRVFLRHWAWNSRHIFATLIENFGNSVPT